MGSDLVHSNNKLEAGERTQQQQLQHWALRHAVLLSRFVA
jgi:hypothetical protein